MTAQGAICSVALLHRVAFRNKSKHTKWRPGDAPCTAQVSQASNTVWYLVFRYRRIPPISVVIAWSRLWHNLSRFFMRQRWNLLFAQWYCFEREPRDDNHGTISLHLYSSECSTQRGRSRWITWTAGNSIIAIPRNAHSSPGCLVIRVYTFFDCCSELWSAAELAGKSGAIRFRIDYRLIECSSASCSDCLLFYCAHRFDPAASGHGLLLSVSRFTLPR